MTEDYQLTGPANQATRRPLMKFIRLVLLAIGVLGVMLFGSAFVVSVTNPLYVERIAKDIIRQQVEKKVHEKIDALDENFIVNKASRLLKGMQLQSDDAKQDLKARLPERLSTVIAEMGNVSCECRKEIEGSIRKGLQGAIDQAAKAKELLTSLIRTKYMETAEKLTREFRIFTGSNALVFALLALAAYAKRGAGVLLIPPALLLVFAAAINGFLYIFSQNWLHTIVFSDYTGFAYVGYMGVVFAFLCDVAFNRGKVTVNLLNAAISGLHAAPC